MLLIGTSSSLHIVTINFLAPIIVLLYILPDHVRVALKKRAAEDMVSLRHVIMTALRARGIPAGTRGYRQ
jgi:hypothetical protein